MKTSYIVGLFALLLISACKTDSKKSEETTETTEAEKTVPERIAEAHGFENWKDVEKITFTFNVDRDSMHFERKWDWRPKTNMVTSISGTDTLTYDRADMDSIALKTNGGFINDRYANEGGYTPGDAYDFYFKDDYIVQEWAYRKSNQEEPNLVSTWEDYVNVEGLQLAKQHNRPDGGMSLYFTGLSVNKE